MFIDLVEQGREQVRVRHGIPPSIGRNGAVREGVIVRQDAGDGPKMCGDFSRSGSDRQRLKQASTEEAINAEPWCPFSSCQAYVRELAR